MSELNELYQQVILDHNKRPHNFHKMESANRKAEGYNPLCGDRIVIYVDLENNLVRNISFEGSGCAISKASASMMTDSVKGKTAHQIQALFERVHQMMTAPSDDETDWSVLGKLAVFSGVREFPVRVKCATLAWHTLNAALQGKQEEVSTE
jgi:nitrogen fixation NifU-like protein